MTKKKITVIGGGTGTSVVLSGLKQHNNLNLNAIVVVSDSGGSTGRLRDEFGFLPIGDARQCIAALTKGQHEQTIKDVLLYRFNKGSGLKGHNLGNLILTALEDITNSPGKAIEIASKIFKISGSVYPITEKNVQLVIEYDDGTIRIGEHTLDDYTLGGKTIKQIKLSPHATIYSKAKQTILESDLIILGPGDLYASILPNTLAHGFKPTLKRSKGKLVYIINLMTHYTQTHNMTAKQHIQAITKYCDRYPDYIIINNQSIPKPILKHYAQNQEYPVKNDLSSSKHYQIITGNFLSSITTNQQPHDTVPRSLLRHNPTKLANQILKLL